MTSARAKLEDGISLDEPQLTVAWTAHHADTAVQLGRAPFPLDPKTGGACTLSACVFMGLPLRVTFHFDATDRLHRVRFDPPPDPVDPRDPEERAEDIGTQKRRHGSSILARRDRLLAKLGQGEAAAHPGVIKLPCPPMTWRAGKTTLLHQVWFVVERGEPEGWLMDYLEVTRQA